MGYSLNHVDDFGAPFQVVHEQIVDVAPGGSHTVQNHVRKLLFVLYGECRHQVVGWGGAGGEVHLRPGDVLSLPHRCEQRYTPVSPHAACRLHVIRLSFDPHLLPPLPLLVPTPGRRLVGFPSANDDILAWSDFGVSEIRCERAASDPVFMEMLLQLRQEAERRAPGYRLRVHSLCIGLLILWARTRRGVVLTDGEPVSEGSAATGAYHVGKIKKYLKDRLHQPTHLADVAEFVGLSEEHVARSFKRATGLTVFDYVRRQRIAEAKSRLAATDANLSEIARATGFSCLTVFSRNFSREVGLTPSEFRRQIARQIG